MHTDKPAPRQLSSGDAMLYSLLCLLVWADAS
jgi:hypothetical protein